MLLCATYASISFCRSVISDYTQVHRAAATVAVAVMAAPTTTTTPITTTNDSVADELYAIFVVAMIVWRVTFIWGGPL